MPTGPEGFRYVASTDRSVPTQAVTIIVSAAPANAAAMSFCASHSSPCVPRYMLPNPD